VRLDVAVNHPLLLGVPERGRRLLGVIARVGHRQRAAPLDDLAQVGARGVLHREHEEPPGHERMVSGYHVGVVQPGGGPDFAQEPLGPGRLQEVRVEHL
jgi:hypothetical protein